MTEPSWTLNLLRSLLLQQVRGLAQSFRSAFLDEPGPIALQTQRLAGRRDRDWLLGWRDICRSTDERTMIDSRLPTTAVGHTLPLVISPQDLALLQVALSSFAFDFVARQKVGGTHMTYSYLEQLAVPRPGYAPPWRQGDVRWFADRADLLQFRPNMDSIARLTIRSELDAAMFHVFGVEREDVDYIMETFLIVKRKDEAAFGEYRTKRMILKVYDAMAEAIATGQPYLSTLDVDTL